MEYSQRVGKWVTYISKDDSGHRGYFEHDDLGEGGGLWFSGFEGKELYDYDGVYDLPKEVDEAIKLLGFTNGGWDEEI